jgi:hypothetical protein
MAKINMSMEDKKYQAKWDLDTLKQAKEIMANAARFKAAQSAAKEQMMALGGIVNAKKPISKKK